MLDALRQSPRTVCTAAPPTAAPTPPTAAPTPPTAAPTPPAAATAWPAAIWTAPLTALQDIEGMQEFLDGGLRCAHTHKGARACVSTPHQSAQA
eukprot:366457-Chlamydomonas_euryale.AAC.8